MGVEVLFIFAVVSGREVCRRSSPLVRVDDRIVGNKAGREIERSFSWPEPDLDALLLATCEGVDPTSDGIEAFAIRAWRISGPTALVVVEVGVTVR